MNIYKFHADPASLDHYEERLTRVPKLAHEHAKRLGRRFPDGEAAIAKDPAYAFLYAYSIINGRFPEGEAAIAKGADAAFEYARYIIKGRWTEGEAAIAKSATYAYMYAKDVIKGRWPEGEAAIAKDTKQSYWKSAYEKDFNVKL
jgi:hypothetical protein